MHFNKIDKNTSPIELMLRHKLAMRIVLNKEIRSLIKKIKLERKEVKK